jgi:putative transposase
VGLLRLKQHRSFKRPRSLRIKRELGVYFVSFCYQEQEALVQEQSSCLEQLAFLKQQSLEYLQAHTVAIDRGVVIAAQTSTTSYDLTPRQSAKKLAKQSYLKQPKGSNRRKTTVHKIGKAHQKIRKIRDNFCHQTSHAIVSNPETNVIILEYLQHAT